MSAVEQIKLHGEKIIDPVQMGEII